MYPYQTNYIPQLQQQYSMQYQQPIQQMPIQQNMFNGKVVNRIEDISVNDVPMDGTRAFFPLGDGSKIVVKNWLANGTIQTQEYAPILNENRANDNLIDNAKTIDLSAITERLDDIENMIRELQPKKTLMKKEVTQND